MRSPSQQVGKCQPGATELIVEPDTEVVQRHPRRQSGPQTLDLMGTLPPEAENVEEFVLDDLDDLTEYGHPPPQAFRPASLFGVTLGRVDEICTVALKPAEAVFDTLKALLSHISSREGRAHAYE